jgi:hypothetical protein
MISCIDLISFLYHDVFPIIIHNQCSDFELISPVYFGHDVIWHILPDQKVDANTMTRASFRRNTAKSDSMIALIYKLQRKNHNPNNQSGANNTKNTSTNHQLLVIWGVDNSHKLCVNIMLIKHNNIITWDEDKLKELYSMHHALHEVYCVIEDTWLLDNEIVLMTASGWGIVNHAIEIIISKGTRKYNSMKPLYIPSNK